MENTKAQSIAIVGMAFRLPGDLSTTDALWNALIHGENLITPIDESRFPAKKFFHDRKSELGKSYTFKAGQLSNIEEFDAAFFGISPREAYQMDPQQRLLLELTWEALENGNQDPEKLKGSSCAVYIGIASNEQMLKFNDDLSVADSYTMLGACPSIAANRISYVFDLHGPSLSIDTACSSSMVALHHACKSIREGEASSAIVGGVNLFLLPTAFVGFSKAMMLSADGACKSFDADGNGYVRSEGCVVFYLKPLEAAIQNNDPIHGVILNSGVNSDGHTNGIAMPSATAQAQLMSQIHGQIGLSADDISYVEAHGTGTPVGDPIEASAIGNAIAKKRRTHTPLLIGSIKSNVGHLETVSGLAGVVKALLCFKHNQIPATNHFKTPNPNIDFDNLNLSVVDQLLDLPKQKNPAIIAVNSFGFGGTNAHVVLSAYTEQPEQAAPSIIAPLLFSVRDETSFPILAAHYRDLLTKNPQNYYDIAYTMMHRRTRHHHNLMIHGDSIKIILDNLEKIQSGNIRSSNSVEAKNKGKELSVALVYSGNGSQWQGMGQELIKNEPSFEKCIDQIDALFLKHGDFSIKTELLATPENSRYHLTEVAQPCLFALQVAMTNYLTSKGIVFKAVLGHSVGEIVAAWASGALTLEQAVEVIYVRSFWQGKTRGHGKMAAIALSDTEIEFLLITLNLSDEIEISAVNSPKGVTVSGELLILEKLKSHCDEKNIFCAILDLDYAFHSQYMDPIKDGLLSALSSLTPHDNSIRYVSTVEGKFCNGSKLDAVYWWRNIREPVKFHDAIDELIKNDVKLFIEVGPHAVLKRYVDDSLAAREVNGFVAPVMKRNSGTLTELDAALFKICMSGAEFNLDHFFPVRGNNILLPAYPWIKEKYCLKPTSESVDQTHLPVEHPLLGYRIKLAEPTWENHLDPDVVAYLADHVVSGLPVMPAAGYAEMALAAAKIWHGFANFDVSDIEIIAPMIFDNAAASRIVRFSLQPDDGVFQIKSRLRHSDETWMLNATGRLMNEPAYIPAREIDVTFSGLKNSFDALLNKKEFYEKAEQLGLSYGPTFQSIEKAWIKDGMGLAILKLHADLSSDFEKHSLHPALLDSCFQLLISFNNKTNDMLLPVRIGRLKVFGKFDGDLQITAKIAKRNKQSILAHFSIINAADVVVAEITDCRFKNVYLDKQITACKNYVCRPHLLPANQNADMTVDTLQSIRDEAEKIISLQAEKASDRFQVTVPLFDLMIGQFVYTTLKTLAGGKTDFSFDTFCASAKIIKSQHALLRQCLTILIEDNYLQQLEEDRFCFIEQKDTIDAMATFNALLRDYPNTTSELLLIARCGSHLADVLCGKIKSEKAFQGLDKNASLENLSDDVSFSSVGSDIVIAAVTTFIKKWPFLERQLRILEITDKPGNLTTRLLNSLPKNKIAYCLATFNEQALVKSKQIAESHPLVKTLSLDLNASFEEQFDSNNACFDLLIIQNSLFQCENIHATLREYHKIVSRDATLLLQENHTDRMQAFVSAVTNTNLQEISFTPKRCERLLTQAGFSVTAPLHEAGASDFEGSFVIMAQPTPATIEKNNVTNEEHPCLILTDDAEAVAPLLKPLYEKQAQIILASCDNNAQFNFNELLAPFSEKFEKLCIISLMGISATDNRSPLLTVENHTDCIIALVKALQAYQWTTQPQLTIVTRGGALCDSDDMLTLTRQPDHAALWGFGRVLANEHPELQCRLIDLQSDALSVVSDRFAQLLLSAKQENEIILSSNAAFALRVATVDSNSELNSSQTDFRLDFSRPGPLKNLQWFPVEKSALADDEVAVKPCASGLNFRDIMYSMGLIPDEAVEDGFLGQTLGMEFAGEIIAVGSKVTDFAKGDKVMGFAPASFSSYAVTKSYAVTPLPAHWSYAAGASIPIAFFTAYYSLTHLARIEPGERILIHGAAGGVGIAAIQLAQHFGAEIYATAGSDEKKDFLTLMGVKHIYHSRDLAFADQIMEQTNGDGVDIVLNCLAGEAIHSNLTILKPFGRFLELGKRDFYANSKIGLRPFRNNISYFGIDADQLIIRNPALSNKLFKEMFNLFDQSILSPLPYREFLADEVHDAFRYMQQSRHIGKIIVNFEEPPTINFARTEKNKVLALNSDATYLVTGGLNGFGFRTAQWLVEKGAKHLVLLGRSGVSSDIVKAGIDELIHQGIDVQARALDITDADSVNDLLLDIKNTMPALKGIFHAAAVYDDAIITNLTNEKMHRVLAPKLLGAWHLHNASITHQLSLDYFVVYSSVTTLIGNPGQANYAAANAFLESLISMRRESKMPGFYVAWGAIDDVGYLARNADVKQSLTAKMGMPVLSSAQALSALEQLIVDQEINGTVISDLNAKTLKRLAAAGASKFELIFSNQEESDSQYNETENDVRKQIADGSLTENTIVTVLTHEIAKILYTAPEKIDVNESLLNIGMDSLMGVELANSIEQSFGVSIPILALSQDPTVNKLAKRLMTQLCKGEKLSPSVDEGVRTILKVTEQHGKQMSEEEIKLLLEEQAVTVY